MMPVGRSEDGRPLLVGREQQLARMRDLLSSGAPSLLLTAVGPGLGQTTFIKAVEWTARELGYDAVRDDGDGELVVTPATTRDAFSARLRAALGVPQHDMLAPATGDFESDAVRRSRLSRNTLSHGTERATADPLVEQLARRPGRALILIDGYRPSPSFAQWFRRDLVGDIVRLGIPSIILVADLPEVLAPLGDLPHMRVDLGVLDRQDVVRFFEELAPQADPPLDDNEVQRYADETLARPELFAALRRLLTLPAQTGATAVTA
jgi:hypothetical protein